MRAAWALIAAGRWGRGALLITPCRAAGWVPGSGADEDAVVFAGRVQVVDPCLEPVEPGGQPGGGVGVKCFVDLDGAQQRVPRVASGQEIHYGGDWRAGPAQIQAGCQIERLAPGRGKERDDQFALCCV